MKLIRFGELRNARPGFLRMRTSVSIDRRTSRIGIATSFVTRA